MAFKYSARDSPARESWFQGGLNEDSLLFEISSGNTWKARWSDNQWQHWFRNCGAQYVSSGKFGDVLAPLPGYTEAQLREHVMTGMLVSELQVAAFSAMALQWKDRSRRELFRSKQVNCLVAHAYNPTATATCLANRPVNLDDVAPRDPSPSTLTITGIACLR